MKIKIINKEFIMILFDKGFMLNDWKTVYVGLKKHWLTPEEVLSYCEYGYILCSEEMFSGMYMSSELSDENLLNLTRKIYPDPIWEKIDDDLYERQIEVSKNYYLFWAVEKLLEIVALGKDKTSKLYEVDMIHSEFDFPIEWHNFIYYMPPKKGEKMGIDVLYDDLIEYIDSSTKQLIESKTIELKKV